MGRSRKPLSARAFPGFESLSLRHLFDLAAICYANASDGAAKKLAGNLLGCLAEWVLLLSRQLRQIFLVGTLVIQLKLFGKLPLLPTLFFCPSYLLLYANACQCCFRALNRVGMWASLFIRIGLAKRNKRQRLYGNSIWPVGKRGWLVIVLMLRHGLMLSIANKLSYQSH